MLEVVGFARSHFKPQDSGNEITGWNIYTQSEDDNVTGVRTERFYLNDGKCDYVPALGDCIRVLYNRYGKVDAIERL